MNYAWTPDEFGTLVLRFDGPHGEVMAWIGPRPPYCDRGHWEFNVQSGVPGLDGADSFPRYFMSLEAAVREASDWLNWRLYEVSFERPRRLTEDDPLLESIDLNFWSAGDDQERDMGSGVPG